MNFRGRNVPGFGLGATGRQVMVAVVFTDAGPPQVWIYIDGVKANSIDIVGDYIPITIQATDTLVVSLPLMPVIALAGYDWRMCPYDEGCMPAPTNTPLTYVGRTYRDIVYNDETLVRTEDTFAPKGFAGTASLEYWIKGDKWAGGQDLWLLLTGPQRAWIVQTLTNYVNLPTTAQTGTEWPGTLNSYLPLSPDVEPLEVLMGYTTDRTINPHEFANNVLAALVAEPFAAGPWPDPSVATLEAIYGPFSLDAPMFLNVTVQA